MKEEQTEKDQWLEEAQYGVKRLKTLGAVASTLSGVLQLEQVLKRALDEAMDVPKADKGGCWSLMMKKS